MLVDINAYVGHWPFKRIRYNNCKELLDRMNKFGVDTSVVSNLNGIFYKNTQSANEELYEEVNSNRRFKNRFILFAIINPTYAGWKYDIDICVNKFGMKGIRLYPKYHDYEIIDPSCIELVEIARDYNLPVAFSLRIVDSRQRSWMDMDGNWDVYSFKEWRLKDIVPIIKKVPDAKYMILNIANNGNMSDEELETLKNSNALFDTSGRAISKMKDYLEKFGKEKFAFGTHSPILDYLTGLLRIESLKEKEADEETKELLRSGNAKRILGL